MSITTMQHFLQHCDSELQKKADGSSHRVYRASPELISQLHLEDRTCVNRNRIIRESKLKDFERRMCTGEWELLTSEPIVYNDRPGHAGYGALLSGQHRLLAAARTNHTLTFEAWGAKTEGEIIHVDDVIKRTAGDAAAIAEGIDPRYVTLMSKVFGYWQLATENRFTEKGCGCYTQNRKSKIGNDVKRHFDNMRGVLEQRFCQDYREQLCRAFIVFLRIGDASHKQIQNFTTILCSPIGQCQNKAVSICYNKHRRYVGAGNSLGMFERIIHMWNSFFTGKPCIPGSKCNNVVEGVDFGKIENAFNLKTEEPEETQCKTPRVTLTRTPANDTAKTQAKDGWHTLTQEEIADNIEVIGELLYLDADSPSGYGRRDGKPFATRAGSTYRTLLRDVNGFVKSNSLDIHLKANKADKALFANNP